MNELTKLEEKTFAHLFRENINRFLEELSALKDTLPIEIAILSMKNDQLLERLKEISISTEELNDSGKEVVRYKANPERYEEFSEIRKHIKRTEIAAKILPRNFIVSIISQYDAFLGELFKSLCQINPNIIRSCERELNVEDLFNYNTIDELKNHIIDKEVDSLLREEHYEQLKVLEKRISNVTGKDFTLTKDLAILPSFIELTQRRNLFVHSNGLTTRQYLEAKKKWNFESDCCGRLNEELQVKPEYCNKAFQILFEMSVKLIHVLWRKFAPEERQLADEDLNDIIYHLLVDNEYLLAIEIANFATNDIKKFSCDQMRKFIIINKAIAFKMLDKEEECKKIIKNEDWSIGNEFKLAKLVLEDDFTNAKALMLKIGNADEMLCKKAYANWPLFKKFRKTEEFKSAYFELFKEEFSIEEVQNKPKIARPTHKKIAPPKKTHIDANC